MSKLLAVLLLVYPRRWRERYGDEFHALSEEARFQTVDYIDIFVSAIGVRMNVLSGKPAWKLLVASVVIGTLAGAGLALLWPRSYQSSAVIRVGDAHGQTEELARALWKTALSSGTIDRIIRANSLYEAHSMTQDERLARFKRDSGLSIVRGGGNAIMVQHVGSTPNTAQRVAEALVNALKAASPQSLKFELINAPSLDKDPISPNILNVILTGALGGLLCGLLLVAVTARSRREPPLRHA